MLGSTFSFYIYFTQYILRCFQFTEKTLNYELAFVSNELQHRLYHEICLQQRLKSWKIDVFSIKWSLRYWVRLNILNNCIRSSDFYSFRLLLNGLLISFVISYFSSICLKHLQILRWLKTSKKRSAKRKWFSTTCST